ncbi:hypothetical protein [Oceanobacter sp. 3_MG-2023]|uniref:hypothetical protein n=1 Tax=Oceanobacter sp. 3_MG-2023 TaxID=3062622 RepID=UPI00273571E6|nr:hypothetical protein [Oceanobacter sp. 3_MG-2023]MDP2505642.1 hypothetical protein [Oceanobacter sp. 3_MG-2023]
MGLFGGGNSSKSTSNAYDNRAQNAAGNMGQAVMGEGNTVTVLDGGAISDAFDFGAQSLEMAGEASSMAFDYGHGVTDQAFAAVDSATKDAFGFTAGAFDAALSESAAARAESFAAISENNNRVDEIYKSAGKETAADAMTAVKWVAGVAVLGLLVMGVRRA